MSIELDIQQAELLSDWSLTNVVQQMLDDLLQQLQAEQTYVCAVCLVDEATSAEMNNQYRHKQGATNILSFPYEAMPGVETNLLGDLIICAEVVLAEASAQNKTLEQHMSHLLVHGVLHLLGYDHVTDEQAEIMEQLEIATLAKAGFPNPYLQIDH
ncbi:MAG: rRNA maturation RNase YbeY [Gammaproteobacteria bacterium]|nr:rRNA maturation RNase YbeY [Gammaproteobacteria bacterium]NNJ71752.1 rRNA maturation RNase YbeY [Enterobacterales bacterium]